VINFFSTGLDRIACSASISKKYLQYDTAFFKKYPELQYFRV